MLMPKKVTKEALLLIAFAVGFAYVATLMVRDAGKEMGATVGGTFVLGLLVSGAAHALPKPKPE